jgi:hypothetical protein
MTFQEWFDYIKTDALLGKCRYFLRNWSAICSDAKGTLADLLAYLVTVPNLTVTQHRQFGSLPAAGTWSIQTSEWSITFRVDDYMPLPSGTRRGCYNLIVCTGPWQERGELHV